MLLCPRGLQLKDPSWPLTERQLHKHGSVLLEGYAFPCSKHRGCIAHLVPPAALALLLAVGLARPAVLQLAPSQVVAQMMVLAAQAALLALLGPGEVHLDPAC